MDDDWNVDPNRSLSESWKGFTKFTLLKEKLPKVFLWNICGLTKIRATTRPENVWPEVWTKNGKSRLGETKSKNGQPRNQSSIMLEV